jgi:hypothetical protein
MENIFEKLIIPNHFFNLSIIIKSDLLYYLDDNLNKENYRLKWDLRNALTINVNGKYI